MKKYIQNTFFICGYLFMITIYMDFKIKELFDLKELFLVIAGAIILTLPYITERKKKVEVLEIIGNNSLFSSYMVALVLVLGKAGKIEANEAMIKEILLSLRPILYGLMIMIMFKQTEKMNKVQTKEVENLEPKKTIKQIETKKFQNEESKIETITEEYCYKLGLTAREMQIVKLVIGGLSNREIGEQLYIAESTVKKHMSNIFEKLGIKNREQLKQMFK